MREPETPTILGCGHVESLPNSGSCYTTDCYNFADHPNLMEWASIGASALLLWWVQWETGRGFVEIILDSLPDLF